MEPVRLTRLSPPPAPQRQASDTTSPVRPAAPTSETQAVAWPTADQSVSKASKAMLAHRVTRPEAAANAEAMQQQFPFRCIAEPLSAPGLVEGQLPQWLRGDLVRIAPAIFREGSLAAEHWFDGLALNYKFAITDTEKGADVRYSQRLLESEQLRRTRAGEPLLAAFGTPMHRSWLQRIIHFKPKMTDNANVNITRQGEKLVAMTETPHHQQVAPASLLTQGPLTWSDGKSNMAMLAHPHVDSATGRMTNVGLTYGLWSKLTVFDFDPRTGERTVIANIRGWRAPYMHSFGVTPNYVILVAPPYDVSPLSMAASDRGYIDHFRWRPEGQTRLIIVDRKTGEKQTVYTEAMMAFHVINAHEKGTSLVLDTNAYANPSVIEELRVRNLASGPQSLKGGLLRTVIDLNDGSAQSRWISSPAFEFPQINYGRCNGQPYRYCYGVNWSSDDAGTQSSIFKLDVEGGAHREWSMPGWIFGEAVFVPRPGGSDEDDGVLVSVGTAKDKDLSAMVVVDAKTMKTLAWAKVNLPIPLGFHGSFVPASS